MPIVESPAERIEAKAVAPLAVIKEVNLVAMPVATSETSHVVIPASYRKAIAAPHRAEIRTHAVAPIGAARPTVRLIRTNTLNKPRAATIAVPMATRLHAHPKATTHHEHPRLPSSHARTTAACACPSS